jgi:hypothetical protein
MKLKWSNVPVAGMLGLVGCGIVPEIPGDYTLPVSQILLAATCELQRAFIQLSEPRYASFNAKKWLIGITLTPKSDRDFTASIGLTGKSTSDTARKYFNTWTAIPGFQGNIKGTSNASVSYKLHSRDLVANWKFQENCPLGNPTFSALAEHLGVHEWLVRTVIAKDTSVGSLATYDKPTFSTEVFVKFSGNGTFTYNFPLGTNIASLAGNYDLDETLAIALTPDTDDSVLVVQTLPTGGQFGFTAPSQVQVKSRVDPQDRLDNIQTQQQIIDKLNNLRN